MLTGGSVLWVGSVMVLNEFGGLALVDEVSVRPAEEWEMNRGNSFYVAAFAVEAQRFTLGCANTTQLYPECICETNVYNVIHGTMGTPNGYNPRWKRDW